jgi:hypothetical protein
MAALLAPSGVKARLRDRPRFGILKSMDGQIADAMFAAIVSFIGEQGGWVTKTKLLKILYLFDVEYFRSNRKTYTGFEWKFLHLGPWTSEFDPILDDVVSRGILSESLGRYETLFYRAACVTELSAMKLTVNDDLMLRRLLRQWGNADTGDILDFVYFNTEPMLTGVRSQALDFSAIQPLPPVYKRSSSGISPKEIQRRREAFNRKQSADPPAHPKRTTPPAYDEQFDRAMAILDSE